LVDAQLLPKAPKEKTIEIDLPDRGKVEFVRVFANELENGDDNGNGNGGAGEGKKEGGRSEADKHGGIVRRALSLPPRRLDKSMLHHED
jgi:hypothetical protein